VSYPSFHPQPEQPARLRAAIKAKVGDEPGWTVRAAERLGVRRTTVSGWVCGRQIPSLAAFVSIATMTGQSLDWLIRGRGP
jgi:hypothetical protein